MKWVLHGKTIWPGKSKVNCLHKKRRKKNNYLSLIVNNKDFFCRDKGKNQFVHKILDTSMSRRKNKNILTSLYKIFYS